MKSPAATASATNSCLWCGRGFQPRRGGSPRVFCAPACRAAFHTAARRWAEQAVASGMLTIAELRTGDPAACTLRTTAFSPAPISEPQKPAAVAPAERATEAVELRLDKMTAMQVRELTWGHPHHEAGSEEMAAAVSALLRYACQARITMPRGYRG
jgi:hypothetical protein